MTEKRSETISSPYPLFMHLGVGEEKIKEKHTELKIEWQEMSWRSRCGPHLVWHMFMRERGLP